MTCQKRLVDTIQNEQGVHCERKALFFDKFVSSTLRFEELSNYFKHKLCKACKSVSQCYESNEDAAYLCAVCRKGLIWTAIGNEALLIWYDLENGNTPQYHVPEELTCFTEF